VLYWASGGGAKLGLTGWVSAPKFISLRAASLALSPGHGAVSMRDFLRGIKF
jgi:hypothetical protein